MGEIFLEHEIRFINAGTAFTQILDQSDFVCESIRYKELLEEFILAADRRHRLAVLHKLLRHTEFVANEITEMRANAS